MHVKYPNEVKYEYPVKNVEKNDLENLQNTKALIIYSNNMQDVYKNIEEYNPDRECKVLIVFDDMITYMISNIKLNQIVTELFITGRKLNISSLLSHNLISQYQKMLN